MRRDLHSQLGAPGTPCPSPVINEMALRAKTFKTCLQPYSGAGERRLLRHPPEGNIPQNPGVVDDNVYPTVPDHEAHKQSRVMEKGGFSTFMPAACACMHRPRLQRNLAAT